MKKWLSILVLLLPPAAAHAFQFHAGDSTNTLVLAAGETLAEETLMAANSLEVRGQAERDLWLLASTSVRFDGASAGDLRVLAGSAVIAGEARQNLLAYARGLHLTTNGLWRQSPQIIAEQYVVH